MKATEERPKLKVEADQILEMTGITLLVCMLGFTVYYYPRLPDIIPTHFDLNGNPDSYGSKSTMYMVPGIAILIYTIISILGRYPHVFNYAVPVTPENAERQYKNAVKMMRVLKVFMAAIFMIIVKSISDEGMGNHYAVYKWLIPGIAILMFFLTMYFLIRSMSMK